MLKVPGIGPEHTRTDDDSFFGFTKKQAKEHEDIIGAEWSWVLKEAGTYSGLSFAETVAPSARI